MKVLTLAEAVENLARNIGLVQATYSTPEPCRRVLELILQPVVGQEHFGGVLEPYPHSIGCRSCLRFSETPVGSVRLLVQHQPVYRGRYGVILGKSFCGLEEIDLHQYTQGEEKDCGHLPVAMALVCSAPARGTALDRRMEFHWNLVSRNTNNLETVQDAIPPVRGSLAATSR